jgi:hypothetical protein
MYKLSFDITMAGGWCRCVRDGNARLPSEVPGHEVVQSSKELDLRS